jgi:uncharacterized protein (TIGR02001 family)
VDTHIDRNLVLYPVLAKVVIRVQGKKGLKMKRVAYSLVLAAGLASSSVMAADMAVKAPPAAAAAPSPWDVVVTAALMNDYNFRGISQSNHKASTQAGFELRYNSSPSLQWYGGISGESISFPNDAAAEIDFYGGVRPTFDKLALDFGAWYYWYPGGSCFNTVAFCNAFGGNFGGVTGVPQTLIFATPNVVKANESFWEVYGKATYTFNDQWAAGIQEYYSPSVTNTGAWGWFSTGNITWTAPSTTFQNGLGMYISGDLGYWDLGTSDAFYGTGLPGPFTNGVKYTSYATWDAGVGFTWKVLTLDLRYYDTNLTKAQCNVFTSAQNATFSSGNVTTQNPGGLGSNWCSAAFVAKLSASVDFASNLK